jgi:hypothetical protein
MHGLRTAMLAGLRVTGEADEQSCAMPITKHLASRRLSQRRIRFLRIIGTPAAKRTVGDNLLTVIDSDPRQGMIAQAASAAPRGDRSLPAMTSTTDW